HDKGHITGKDFHQLSQAYEFLRRLEHRLQLHRGQQRHRLPEARVDMEIAARSMGNTGDHPAEALLSTLERHRGQVAEIYERSVHAQQNIRERTRAQKEFVLAPAITIEEARDGSYEQLLERLSLDSPELHLLASRRDLSARTRRLLH